MADDKNNKEAGDEIAQGIATTPNAAPNPWEMKLSPGEVQHILQEDSETLERQAKAKVKRDQDLADAGFAHRETETAVGGYDADDVDPQFLELDRARKSRVDPVLWKGEHPNAVTLAERTQFLANYVKCGLWNHAAYIIGRSGKTFRELARNDPVFAIQVGEAVQDWRENIQSEIVRRGLHGTLTPVFAGKDGNLVGHVRVYSDMLLKMEAEAAWPARYRPNHVVQQEDGANRNQGVMVVPGVAKTEEEWERAAERRRNKASTVERTTRPVNRLSKPTGQDK